MADEDVLDLDIEDSAPQITRDNKRIETLSSKVRETAAERDAAKASAEAAEAAKVAAEKETAFYKDFSSQAGRYPAAAEFQDAIKEKVLAGYSVEDATVAVLNREGKLTAPAVPPPPLPGPAAGGSASFTPTAPGDKSVAEMTRDEKRTALLEAEKRGDISLT